MTTNVKYPRNPRWHRDELILALDLYLRLGPVGKEHPAVHELSTLLNLLRLSPVLDEMKYRNENGVAQKLQNFRFIDTGKGLSHGGKLDEALWRELSTDRARLSSLVAGIRARAQN